MYKRQEEYEQVIGNYLIGSIDRNGYLCVDLNEVASNLKVPLHKVEKVLNLIQSFHPHGVGARDLSECLLLQLRYYNKEDSDVYKRQPNLLVKGVAESLTEAKAPLIYVSNIMTEKGETDGFTAADHLQAIKRHLNQQRCV